MSDLNLTIGGKFFSYKTGIAIIMKELKIDKKYAAWKTIMEQTLTVDSIPHIMHYEKGKNWEEGRYGAVVIPKARAKLQKPKLYRVFLLNDDYTPMDFVVFILKNFFKKVSKKQHGLC